MNSIARIALPIHAHAMEIKIMNENLVVGAARNLAGKTQETVGQLVGDAKTRAEGLAGQAKGVAQELYGRASEGASQIADAAKETTAGAQQTASSFENSLRSTIETQPYTAVFLALGLGWLLGRMHRPM
jgi:uncharacterized protein YjbJ (UPF0337 family)